ncbi:MULTISPECIES: NAD-dependent epimerase/dehydratase family protein [unclassified Streptomyces]|uniref:NAD-dependent epimerase/dehydratase family protein n=1 Tax=unclassified Streptomyces TaxID=2593676 RepID=UPI000747F148|nr:NAD-dependent epimerase/dehydratase family protein [Streptomyces sp. NRRL S-1521]KUL58510.1 hypothetical protein ADL30_09995 [Streptomyces sp. NRRL S-1521]THC48718.1 hypothetical protein E7X58_23720 [Streptomyces sp. A1499]
MSTATRVLVTGGTGTTGRRVTARLVAAGHAVRVASRHPDPAVDDVAATLTRVTGRTVRHRAVSREAMRDRLTATGLPEPFADLLAGMDEAIAGGAEDRTSDVVERVTGRAPRTFAAHVAAHLARAGHAAHPAQAAHPTYTAHPTHAAPTTPERL